MNPDRLKVGDRVWFRGVHAKTFSVRGTVEGVLALQYQIRLENGNVKTCNDDQVKPRGPRLKVYGWMGHRPGLESPGRNPQTREIVATRTKRDVALLAGETDPRKLHGLEETENAEELEAAFAETGTILWRPLHVRQGGWRKD